MFTCNDIPRFAFGFYNPNHAAALICALLPFCWGWRRVRLVGWALGAALLVALAATFSRTGFVVLALEAVAWLAWRGGRDEASPSRFAVRPSRFAVIGAVAVAAVWWMWPRLTLDGAVLNRPQIWRAGLVLAAANPLGVGFGNSGSLASAFLLSESISVRTLVNSHLTLLAESGALVGGLWLAFIVAAAAMGRTMPRTRIAFSGLAISAFSASVFDWHVLFDFVKLGGIGTSNFILSWVTLAGFVVAGCLLIVRGWSFRVGVLSTLAAATVCGGIALLRISDAPCVEDGFVAFGAVRPVVFHDSEWPLRVLKGYFPEGARIRIESGVAPFDEAEEVWLFGTVAESSGRFPDAAVTVVSPPEYYEPGINVKHVER